ncbi:MAG: hypothetical protein ACLFVO_28835, partial [Chloroflexaceae bacterium]
MPMTRAAIAQRIADIEATLALPDLPSSVRQLLEQEQWTLRMENQHLAEQSTVNVGDNARIYGPTVGLNLGTIIYGRDPQEDERRRLVWYLEGLAATLVALPLRGLDDHLHRGRHLELPGVYVALATESRVEVARGHPAELRRYFDGDAPNRPLKPDYDPDQVLPDTALYRAAGTQVIWVIYPSL